MLFYATVEIDDQAREREIGDNDRNDDDGTVNAIVFHKQHQIPNVKNINGDEAQDTCYDKENFIRQVDHVCDKKRDTEHHDIDRGGITIGFFNVDNYIPECKYRDHTQHRQFEKKQHDSRCCFRGQPESFFLDCELMTAIANLDFVIMRHRTFWTILHSFSFRRDLVNYDIPITGINPFSRSSLL
jgi:hypothetical protein